MLPMLCVTGRSCAQFSCILTVTTHSALKHAAYAMLATQVCLDNRAKHGLRRTDTVTVLSWTPV